MRDAADDRVCREAEASRAKGAKNPTEEIQIAYFAFYSRHCYLVYKRQSTP